MPSEIPKGAQSLQCLMHHTMRLLQELETERETLIIALGSSSVWVCLQQCETVKQRRDRQTDRQADRERWKSWRGGEETHSIQVWKAHLLQSSPLPSERERERDRDRQTDRQTERKTDRQTERKTDGHGPEEKKELRRELTASSSEKLICFNLAPIMRAPAIVTSLPVLPVFRLNCHYNCGWPAQLKQENCAECGGWINSASVTFHLVNTVVLCLLCQRTKLYRDLAPKANVLRCRHRHRHTPQRGGWHVSMWWHISWGVAHFNGEGFWLWLMAGRGVVSRGIKHRSRQAWITVCSNTTHLFQRQRSK